jgi:hypothetical protein
MKDIPGGATSWTPSGNERLSNNGTYVWFVRAQDSNGQGAWSEGRMFRIEAGEGFSAIAKAVNETLEKHGIDHDIIEDVIGSMNEAIKNETEFRSIDSTPLYIQGHESDNNTWYGLSAGLSITSGTNNALFGYETGTSVSSGIGNTSIGRWAGKNTSTLSTEEAMNTLKDLVPVKFNYKADKLEEYVGFIAEDVPELVATKNRKGMSPMDVVAVLTKVVQEQQETIDKLQKRIEGLERK